MRAWRRSPRDSDPESVARLLSATGFFSEAEVRIGAELVEESLALGEAAGYHYMFEDRECEGLSGYCCFGPIPLTVGSWDLYWIAVLPGSQGGGRGTALLQAAEREMARLGASQVFVDTSGREQYTPTRRFYEARGYTVAARLEDFYAPGDDKVVYRRSAWHLTSGKSGSGHYEASARGCRSVARRQLFDLLDAVEKGEVT